MGQRAGSGSPSGNAFFTEIVFLHRETGTLIVTDFIENIHAETVGMGWKIGARLFGLWQEPSPSRILLTSCTGRQV
jgi:hypothetical protein